ASLALPPPFDMLSAILAATALASFLRWHPAFPVDAVGAVRASGQSKAGSSSTGRRRRMATASATAAVSAVLLSAMVVSAQPDGRLHMTVLDVGQGDSILLQGPAGGRILIDTGPDPNRLI